MAEPPATRSFGERLVAQIGNMRRAWEQGCAQPSLFRKIMSYLRYGLSIARAIPAWPSSLSPRAETSPKME